jgi:hypothetical protein
VLKLASSYGTVAASGHVNESLHCGGHCIDRKNNNFKGSTGIYRNKILESDGKIEGFFFFFLVENVARFGRTL